MKDYIAVIVRSESETEIYKVYASSKNKACEFVDIYLDSQVYISSKVIGLDDIEDFPDTLEEVTIDEAMEGLLRNERVEWWNDGSFKFYRPDEKIEPKHLIEGKWYIRKGWC